MNKIEMVLKIKKFQVIKVFSLWIILFLSIFTGSLSFVNAAGGTSVKEGASFIAHEIKIFGSKEKKAIKKARDHHGVVRAVAVFTAPTELKPFDNANITKMVPAAAHFKDKAKSITTVFAAPLKLRSVNNSHVEDGRIGEVTKEILLESVPLVARATPTSFIDRDAARGYLKGIRRKVDSAKEYPRVAMNFGQEGDVRVGFTVMQDGQIEDLLLLAETPFPALNKEALEMIRRAAPFSHLPETIGMSSMKVILPFTFQLN